LWSSSKSGGGQPRSEKNPGAVLVNKKFFTRAPRKKEA